MKKLIILSVLGLALVGCQKNTNLTQEINTNQSVLNQNQAVNQNVTMPSTQTSPTPDKDLSNITKAIIKTNLGNITVEFFNQDAPKTVANFVKLASAGFYDGTKFHRVIKDFMIQGGDPLTKDDSLKNSWGTGGPDYRFADEINSHKLVRGSLAMANSGPDTNGCQFFIVTAESTPWLDGKHTNFGQVVAGLDVVDKIENIKTQGPDRPISNVIIESVELK